MDPKQFESMTSSRYEQILALIEQEAQDAVDGGICDDPKEAMLVLLDGIAHDLNLTDRA
jgi:hypothetical protein